MATATMAQASVFWQDTSAGVCLVGASLAGRTTAYMPAQSCTNSPRPACISVVEKDKDSPGKRAYAAAGLNVEPTLRGKLTGLRFRAGKPHKRIPPKLYIELHITLADVKFPIDVWLVDGSLV